MTYRSKIRTTIGKISPIILSYLLYYKHFKKILNLYKPKTFNEKINRYKLFSWNELWVDVADKYRVRQYVESKSLKHILVKLYGVWDDVDSINFNTLPDKFILKSNNGCGTVLIIEDKNTMNEAEVRVILNGWLNNKFGIATAEPHYLHIKPRIIAEELLMPSKDDLLTSSSIVDYKWFCFSGEPIFAQVVYNRQPNHIYNFAFYDINWTRLKQYESCRVKSPDIKKPTRLKEMLDIARTLSKDFKHARIDLYQVDNKIYFGEITLTNSAGYDIDINNEFDKILGGMFV